MYLFCFLSSVFTSDDHKLGCICKTCLDKRKIKKDVTFSSENYRLYFYSSSEENGDVRNDEDQNVVGVLKEIEEKTKDDLDEAKNDMFEALEKVLNLNFMSTSSSFEDETISLISEN